MADAKRSSSAFPVGQQQSSSQFKDWECGERYLLERILGKGSYGQVAQAIDRLVGEKYVERSCIIENNLVKIHFSKLQDYGQKSSCKTDEEYF
jgi:hypothetical protein